MRERTKEKERDSEREKTRLREDIRRVQHNSCVELLEDASPERIFRLVSVWYKTPKYIFSIR